MADEQEAKPLRLYSDIPLDAPRARLLNALYEIYMQVYLGNEGHVASILKIVRQMETKKIEFIYNSRCKRRRSR